MLLFSECGLFTQSLCCLSFFICKMGILSTSTYILLQDVTVFTEHSLCPEVLCASCHPYNNQTKMGCLSPIDH